MPAKLAGGLNEGQRQLVRDLYLPLRRFAAVVGPQELEPDDLVQEAFLLLLRRGALDDAGNLVTTALFPTSDSSPDSLTGWF